MRHGNGHRLEAARIPLYDRGRTDAVVGPVACTNWGGDSTGGGRLLMISACCRMRTPGCIRS